MTLLLQTFERTSDFALNGKQALEAVKKRRECDCRYQLILLDCNMPIMDGYDTCKELKKMVIQNQISPLHIIAVTADATPSNIKRCEKAGFDQIVSKPIQYN